MAIIKKSKAEIEKMRVAGRLVHQILESCRAMCRPGVTTRQIDEHAGAMIEQHGGKGLFKNYPGPTPFPCNLCISVNDVVVHGIADDRAIQEGDIIGIDCGVAVDGWCGDSARTFLVGDVRKDVRNLCEVTEHVLALAVQHIRPGKKWSQIARVMQNYA